MGKLMKALELRKAKYLRRTGGPGHYKYVYKESVRREKKVEKDTGKEKSLQEIEKILRDWTREYYDDWIVGKDLRKVYEENKSKIEQTRKLRAEEAVKKKEKGEKKEKEFGRRQKELDKYVREEKERKVSAKDIPYMTDNELKNISSVEDVRRLLSLEKEYLGEATDQNLPQEEVDKLKSDLMKKMDKKTKTIFTAINNWALTNHKIIRQLESSFHDEISFYERGGKKSEYGAVLGAPKAPVPKSKSALQRFLPQLKVLRSFLENAPKYKGSLSRGIDINLNMKVGEEHVLKAMASFGRSRMPPEGFRDFKSIMIVKNNTRGVDITPFSDYSGAESEVLVPKGKYKVVKIINRKLDGGGTQKVYHLEEV